MVVSMAIIMYVWVCGASGSPATWSRCVVLTYMMSTCSQSAPWAMVREHAAPRSAKSAERMDGAMIALGAILGGVMFSGCDGVLER